MAGVVPRGIPREERCTFVKETESCQEIEGALDYLEIYYCTDVSQAVAKFLLALFVVWWCLLIVVLGASPLLLGPRSRPGGAA
jgi:hypothetical protein